MCYQEVFDLLPEPKLILEVATWLLTATTPKSTGYLLQADLLAGEEVFEDTDANYLEAVRPLLT